MQFLVTSSRLSIVSVFFTTLFLAPLAHSAEYCMMLGGTKTSGPTQADTWTTDNCYGNLSSAWSAMGGGDTLVIDDGNYTHSSNAIRHYNRPPSGTREAMTIVKARNIPGQATDDLARYPEGIVPVNSQLKVRFTGDATFRDSSALMGVVTQYVMFEGLHWNGIGTSSHWDYIYFKQCSSMGVHDGNNATWSITGKYNLIEDSVAYGKGRIKFLFYDNSREEQVRGNGNNICRRCVARQDWAMKDDEDDEPINAFFSYYNRGTVFQNVMDVDSNLPQYWNNRLGINLNGSLTSFEVNNEIAHKMDAVGSVLMNNAYGFGSTSNPGNSFTDIAVVNIGGGIFTKRSDNSYTNLSLLGINTDPFDYRSNQFFQPIFGLTKNNGFMPNSRAVLDISNLIARDIVGDLARFGARGDYVNYFNVGEVSTTLTNAMTFDPYENGQRYPVRVENGSVLKTAGRNGGRMGAEIMYRIGVDGAFQGEAGWDTVTEEPLWPWPLQEWVQAQMRSSDYESFCATATTPCPATYMTDAYRGYAANDQRLTEYIWAGLGNTPPPFNVKATGGSSLVHLSWDTPPDAYIDNITQFNVYDVTGQTDPVIPGVMSPTTTVVGNSTFSATIGSLTAGQNYEFAVTAVDSVTGESGYSYTVSATPATVAISNPQSDFLFTPANNDAVTVSGIAHVDSTVDIYINENLVSTVTANNLGNWTSTLDLSSNPQHSGALVLKVTSSGDESNGVSGINLTSVPSQPSGITIQFQ